MKKKQAKKSGVFVVGIDPGLTGAIALTNGEDEVEIYELPIRLDGKDKIVDFESVGAILCELECTHIYLERAVPMAMGSKHAFNYGRSFEAIVLAVKLSSVPYTYVEPQKWAKEMHEGISTDLKPKAKSLVAVGRLFPRLVSKLPTKPKGGLKDGPIDALLIAGYGLRKNRYIPEDFY